MIIVLCILYSFIWIWLLVKDSRMADTIWGGGGGGYNCTTPNNKHNTHVAISKLYDCLNVRSSC